MTDSDLRASGASRVDLGSLRSLRVPELVALATSLGITNAARLRKAELVAAITENQNGDDNAENTPVIDAAGATAEQADTPQTDGVEQTPADAEDSDSDVAAEAPVEPAGEQPVAEPVAAEGPDVEVASDAPAPAEAAEVAAVAEEAPATKPRARRPRRATSATVDAAPAEEAAAPTPDADAEAPEPKSAAAHVNHGETGITADVESAAAQVSSDEAPAEGQHDGSHPGEAADGAGESADTAAEGSTDGAAPTEGERPSRRGRGRGRGRDAQNAAAGEAGKQEQGDQPRQQNGRGEQNRQNGNQGGQNQGEQGGRQNNQNAQNQNAQNQNAQNQGGQNQGGQNRGDQGDQGDDRQERSGRSRYRDRKRGRGATNDDFEPEISDDDVLIPVAGILDVLDNYAFVRTSGYLPGPSDVYVSLGQVKKYNLRKGDAVVGAIRQPRDNDGGRQKYNAIVKIDSVNGQTSEEAAQRVEFASLTPLYPQERLRFETEKDALAGRVIDLVSPVGKGQRGLIVSPPKSGKTFVLQGIADAVAKNNPEAHLMVVLVDERPEDVTEMQRRVKGEVIASTFDRPAEDHTTLAELAIERAKRLVELGHDVVVLLDSITRLGRAYASTSTAGRPAGALDSAALYPAKRFFGAARNVENGGSLTILATALVETGSAADEAVFEEFTATANMELRLSRSLADKRIFPAVVIGASSTRREEMLMGAEEVEVTWKLRRALADADEQAALETVLGKLAETSSNVEYLMQVQKSTPTPATGGGRSR